MRKVVTTSNVLPRTTNNTVTQRENDNSPGPKLQVREGCDLRNRELSMAGMRALSKMQENSNGQLNELRNKGHEQKEYFTKRQNCEEKKKRNRNSGVAELK